MESHEVYMRRCIEIARAAEGRTSPNPLVGALVVADNGQVIAEGFHARHGEPHAEVLALNEAGERARGHTLYVSLEPCCHFGKTPPCSERVIASGVKRVVFGMVDPNPKVAGGGQRALEAAGIATVSGVLESECRYLNRGFLKWLSAQRPWLTLKMAATMDGRIADRQGISRWVSGPAARAHVHQLRNRYDCVLIGAATAVKDNPELTVRDLPNARDPLRVVVDGRLQISPDSRLCRNADGNTWICATEPAIKEYADRYTERIRLVATPEQSSVPNQGGSSLDLAWLLNFLGSQRLRTVLCEGGSRLAGALLQAELVDEVEWIVAPKLLVDRDAVPAVADSRPRALDQAITFISHTYKELGEDLLIRGLIHAP